jgi:cytochrome c biogenesis protein CcdA
VNFTLAYLAGILTIASPCILPVLPFVLTRTGQPFRSSTLPMLLGMALAFAGVASLAAVAGNCSGSPCCSRPWRHASPRR